MFTGFKKDNNYFLPEVCFQTYVKEVCGPPSMSMQTFLLLIFSCYSILFFLLFMLFFSHRQILSLKKVTCFILGCPSFSDDLSPPQHTCIYATGFAFSKLKTLRLMQFIQIEQAWETETSPIIPDFAIHTSVMCNVVLQIECFSVSDSLKPLYHSGMAETFRDEEAAYL